jgi:predicted Zn-dependent protease
MFLAFAACAVNPVTHKTELSLMGEAQEVRTGEEAYPVYTQMSEGLFQDEGLQRYVQSVGEKVARESHRPNLDYRFNVVNASEINAYALPGGKISITRGLLTRMRNEAELASVLGHEVGHVTARHAAAGYTRQVLAGVLTSVGAAVLQTANVQGGDLLAQGGMLAANLVLMKYSRDQERQSDELGMGYMVKAGYNPEGMVQTMEVLMAGHDREPSAVEAMFQSHPLTSERVAAARERAARQNPALRTEAALRTEPFEAAVTRLRDLAPAYVKMDQGRQALAQKKYTEALGLLAGATSQAPDQALLWVFRAAAEAGAGKKSEALASAEKAVALYPGLYPARFNAGVLAFEAGKHAQSLDHLAEAERLVPGQPQVAFFQGRNREALGQREEAAQRYAKVLESLRQGPMAEYAYQRLVEWGYVRPPAQQPVKR